MKKLLVLSVLLGLMALPMFASDITFGGDVTFGFIGDFGDNENEVWDATVDLMATIDDYNSLTINTDGLESGTWNGISKILVTTDVGMVFDLPVGVVINWGYDDPDRNEFQVISGYENEDPIDFSPAEYWGLDFLVSYEFLEVEFAFNPTAAATIAPVPANGGSLLAGVAVKEPIAGLNAEVYYFQGGGLTPYDEFGDGAIGFDAAYAADFDGFAVEAGATFDYNLSDVGDAWAYGIGLSGAYSIATVTVGLAGNESDALNDISATGVFAPVDMLDVYAGMWYDMAGSELIEVDLGANPHLGAVEMYIGYLIGGDSTFATPGDHFNAPPGLGSGESGAYVKFDVNY
jgi:hypothetical protein